MVRTTREGEIRWTTLSIFNGTERWRSESIQLGGIRSSKVIGNWFDKYVSLFRRVIVSSQLNINVPNRDYHPTGPCGPTAFWKIGDRHPSTPDDRRSFLSLLYSAWGNFENCLFSSAGLREVVREILGLLNYLRIEITVQDYLPIVDGCEDDSVELRRHRRHHHHHHYGHHDVEGTPLSIFQVRQRVHYYRVE